MDRVQKIATMIFNAIHPHGPGPTDMIPKPAIGFQTRVGEPMAKLEKIAAWELYAPLAKQIIDEIA